MRIIRDYYSIEPGDSLDEIKYIINLGCKVLGCLRAGIYGLRLFNIYYNKDGEPIETLKFKKYNKKFNECNSYFWVRW